MGNYYGRHVPALQLTVLYDYDFKASKFARNVKLSFQPAGPCDAQLNFPHAEVKDSYLDSRHLYMFWVQLHAVFPPSKTIRRTTHVKGKVGADGKLLSGELESGYEYSEESHDSPVFLNVEYVGSLDAFTNKIEVRGHLK